jgi:hypothetical protein
MNTRITAHRLYELRSLRKWNDQPGSLSLSWILNTRLLNTRFSIKDTESLPGVAGVIHEAIEVNGPPGGRAGAGMTRSDSALVSLVSSAESKRTARFGQRRLE